MRLWTLHPQYLDAQGLVALWREALLAQKVLQGATKGYTHHPQLGRFRATDDPLAAIGSYLTGVFEEAERRGYSFDSGKIPASLLSISLQETRGQLIYEWTHLLEKLQRRNAALYAKHRELRLPAQHPLFRIVPGSIQPWERPAKR